jgi:hypothetical protein
MNYVFKNEMLEIYLDLRGGNMLNIRKNGHLAVQELKDIHIQDVQAVGEVSGPKFLIKYMGCAGHVQAVAEVCGKPFFIIYTGRTGHVQAVGEFSEPTLFIIYIYIYILYRPCTGCRKSLWNNFFHHIYI